MKNNFLKYYNERKADFDNMLDLVDEYLSNEVKVDMGVVSQRQYALVNIKSELNLASFKGEIDHETASKISDELLKIKDFYFNIELRNIYYYSKAFCEMTTKVNKADFKIV